MSELHDLRTCFCAVIISYNPEIERLESIVKNLSNQGLHVIIIDNGSENVEDVRQIKDAELVELSKNCGIAAALNVGMKRAREYGAEWVLSSDQDTIIDTDIVSHYLRYTKLPQAGALCPRIIKQDGEVGTKEAEYYEVDRCPTSGFFLATEAWEKSGKYDEWLFIDYVDYDMCVKLKIAGYKIYRIPSTFIIQELGKHETSKSLSLLAKLLHSSRIERMSHIYAHNPLRNYYFVRNGLYYLDHYSDHINRPFERAFFLRWELKRLLFEKKHFENIKYLFKGIADYKKKMRTLH